MPKIEISKKVYDKKKINYFQIAFKSVEHKNWVIKIKWFASTPDVDRRNDVVLPWAFDNSIKTYMENPVVLLQHDEDKWIWKTIDYALSNDWLEIEAEISNDIDNVFKWISDWILKGFSIWYIAKKWSYFVDEDKEIRQLEELDLVEISVVSVPANPSSLFTLQKSLKKFFNNLQTENMTKKENKNTEEPTDTWVDTSEFVKTIESEKWTEDKILDESEKAGETPDSQEWPVENTVQTNDPENKEDKSFTEIKELKTTVSDLIDLAQKQFEQLKNLSWKIDEQDKEIKKFKDTISNMAIKKWLATIPFQEDTEKKSNDSFVKAFKIARQTANENNI